MPADVKTLLQKFPSFLCTGDVKLIPTYGVEHHIHTGSHPSVFAKSRRLDPEKLQIAKAEFKRLESAAHGSQKRRIVAALWRLLPLKFGDNPEQVAFAKHEGPFQWLRAQLCQIRVGPIFFVTKT